MNDSPEYAISKLSPKAGDVIVVKFHRHITLNAHERANAMIKEFLPEGVKGLLVDHDVDVSLLTAEEIAQRAVTDDRTRAHSVSLDPIRS
jgi:hypothetical protein